jgi:hypothetical protein
MPHSDNPDDFAFDTVEKAIGGDHHFSIRKLGEFQDDSPRIGKLFQSP